jgi:Asp-tRNA(Asn)/Glu-tRNA(Gln) amidotransferase A subunit family amidase
VAAGFSPLANGSDGGASIRVPAGFCGVVGLKPTAGRIPVWPEVSPFESSSAVGPITRTVADSALMLDIMAGPDPSEPYAVPAPAVPFLEGLEGADVAGKRLAFAVEGFGPVEPDVVDSLTTLARHLEHRGAHVEFVSVELPDLIQYFYDYWAAVMGPELFESARELAAYPPLMRWLDYSQKMNVSQYLDASFTRRVQIRTALVGVLREHDFLITPTTTRVAFPHPDRDLLGPSHILGQPVREPAIDFARFTDPPSQANLPALSIPCGFSAEGLPYGAQIVGPHAADGPVLQLGSAIEQSLNLLHRRPLSA